jgi:hypothetical protein
MLTSHNADITVPHYNNADITIMLTSHNADITVPHCNNADITTMPTSQCLTKINLDITMSQ